MHVSGTEYIDSLGRRTPDHNHHYGVPTKSILESALSRGKNWASLFSRKKYNPIPSNIVTVDDQYQPQQSSKCC